MFCRSWVSPTIFVYVCLSSLVPLVLQQAIPLPLNSLRRVLMVDLTYSKVTATVSMTNFERRNARKMAKELAKNGHTDVQQPPAQPRREGLRGRKFAYSNSEAPRRVVRRDPAATQPKAIPIPRLEGQEGLYLYIYDHCSVF